MERSWQAPSPSTVRRQRNVTAAGHQRRPTDVVGSSPSSRRRRADAAPAVSPLQQRRATTSTMFATVKLAPKPLSMETRDRVRAMKQYMYDFYYSTFRRLRERQARLDAINHETRLMAADKAMAHRLAHYQRETNHLRNRRRKMRLGEFNILAVLGKGAFGAVYLARKEDTCEVLALKKMRKDHFDKKNKIRVQREKQVLLLAKSDWLIRLAYSFQDEDHLYLAMEYVPGGDLRALLTNVGTLPEDMAQWYLAEMVCAVHALHLLGYAHRDLKPDNFLIDQWGHIKLGDFGLSKDGVRSNCETLTTRRESIGTLSKPMDFRTRRSTYRAQQGASFDNKHGYASVVGSPDYMAVEILRGDSYDHRVDWWSLGVIFYEMLAGLPPFYAAETTDVFTNILDYQNTLLYPEFEADEDDEEEEEEEESMSDNAWLLIQQLVTEANQRLTHKAIRRHPYFEGTDWDHLREYEAPFVPELDGETDTSYFEDACLDVEPPCERPEDGGAGGQHFFGFTYKKFAPGGEQRQ